MLGGNVTVEVDRSDRAFGFARAAVDALVGIDVHLDAGEPGRAFGRGDLANLLERDRNLRGNRDQRNAILRDTNRTLHPYVLKNPQITIEDVLAIVKNAQSSPELLKQVSERRDWFQRPQVAFALARNPKSPPEVAVRALD